jgi:hypothetical protein
MITRIIQNKVKARIFFIFLKKKRRKEKKNVIAHPGSPASSKQQHICFLELPAGTISP